MMVAMSASSQFDHIFNRFYSDFEQLDTKLCQLFVTISSQKGVHFHNVF